MSIETVILDHLPARYAVHLVLVRNVRNAAFLHSQLLARNSDFEYALVDASVVRFLDLFAGIFSACIAGFSFLGKAGVKRKRLTMT